MSELLSNEACLYTVMPTSSRLKRRMQIRSFVDFCNCLMTWFTILMFSLPNSKSFTCAIFATAHALAAFVFHSQGKVARAERKPLNLTRTRKERGSLTVTLSSLRTTSDAESSRHRSGRYSPSDNVIELLVRASKKAHRPDIVSI